jgi:hypothetical protein
MACWADVVIVVDDVVLGGTDVGNGVELKPRVSASTFPWLAFAHVVHHRIPESYTTHTSIWQQQSCLKYITETVRQLLIRYPQLSEPRALNDDDMAQVPDKVLSWLYSVLHVRQNPPT